ncbi:MAG: mechanosensitive ion channel, partial [bacterium]|nr:mechanosensitive ion channel [bacterium]
GGRRIKRSINIDLDSIKFCDQKLLDKLKAVKFLKDHIDSRLIEISLSDEQNPKEAELSINGRRLTNIGLFRAYITRYLSNNNFIHAPGKGYTFLVRQLQPTDLGLPLEIYVFTTETAWDLHENIQADIFDHLFAALPFFELKAFQGSVIQKV